MTVPVPGSNGSHNPESPSVDVATANGPVVAVRDAEHATWLAAFDLWRDEIDRWREEHASAVARLRALQQAVQDHDRCLIDHLESLQRVSDAVTDHERLLEAQASGAAGEAAEMVAERHQRCGSLFGQLKDAQERIARHHNAFMSRMQAVEKAAAAPL
jgi:hypothetical protein